MKIGFIGVGTMGWPMAQSLAKAGYDVIAFDANAARAARFAAENGGAVASSFADLAAADVVITMLPTGGIVRNVYVAPESGLAPHLRRGTIAIDMSSSEPDGTRTLGRELMAYGISLIDAPVSGAVARARSATLTIMIGGDDAAAVGRVKGVLSAMGNRLFDTGGLGTGHAMKALNNFVAAAGYSAAIEALAIGNRFGLDSKRMLEIINVSTGRNFNTETVIQEHVLEGGFATGFALGLMAKDVRTAAEMGAAHHVDAPLSVLLSDRWALAVERLGAARDFSAAALSWDGAYRVDRRTKP